MTEIKELRLRWSAGGSLKSASWGIMIWMLQRDNRRPVLPFSVAEC